MPTRDETALNSTLTAIKNAPIRKKWLMVSAFIMNSLNVITVSQSAKLTGCSQSYKVKALYIIEPIFRGR
ncbi:hypothetical protein GCM10007978_02090 [Shewanella hanedai]|nr:hypothetical protein GCM10007978_02090 [Shewanella hanedai]